MMNPACETISKNIAALEQFSRAPDAEDQSCKGLVSNWKTIARMRYVLFTYTVHIPSRVKADLLKVEEMKKLWEWVIDNRGQVLFGRGPPRFRRRAGRHAHQRV